MAGPIAGAVQAAINHGLGESASARAVCAELEGRGLALLIDPPGLKLRLVAERDRVRVDGDTDAADASLAAGPAGLARLALGDPEAAIRAGHVRIGGDPAIAERFRVLLALARPDLEEVLARAIGDVPAHQIGNAARGLARWGAQFAGSLGRSLGEYLQEERRDVPPPAEVQDFLDDVDRLANDVERAAARVDRLRRRAAGG